MNDCYQIVVIGTRGHGLATAYYLAKEFGIMNVAVLDRGWLGGQYCPEQSDDPVELPA